MTENVPTPETSTPNSEPFAARLRDGLRRYNPLYLAPLGFLSIPTEFVDGMDFLDIFGIFYLFFLWIFVGPIVDIALRTRLDEDSDPTDWIGMGSWKTILIALGTMPLMFLNPLVLFQDIRQFLGGWLGALRYGGRLPDVESYEQSTSYRLPFDTEWTVVNGSPEREYSHSWIYPNQRYAYDFVITDKQGNTKPEETSATVEEYYCYDEAILAPAEGTVVDAFDSALETTHANGFSHPASRDIRGGYVVIKHADDEYSMLAHLKPGSVPVENGEQVNKGQEIGRCGHSGNSSEPHLHFQVQDHPSFELAVSLPVQFDCVEIDSPGETLDEDLIPGAETTDGIHDQAYVVAGQRVTHVNKDMNGSLRDDERDSDGYARGEKRHQSTQSRGERDGVASTLSTRALKHFTVGLGVAGIVLFVVRILWSGWPLVGALFGVSATGLVFGLWYRSRSPDDLNTRSFGLPTGLGTAGLLLAGFLSGGASSGAVVGLLLLIGLGGFLLTAEYERHIIRDTVPSDSDV